MTDREKAIVMAYTGIAMFKGEKIDEYYKYLKELYGRPVYTHEIVTLDIAEKAKPDFIRLCEEHTPERTETHTCDYGKNETHGDVIYRQVAIGWLTNEWDGMVTSVFDGIKNLPSAQPERKTGKWIRHDEIKNVYGGICIECSECGEKYVVQHIEDEKFCRNCGADMRSESVRWAELGESLVAGLEAGLRGEDNGRFNQPSGGD